MVSAISFTEPPGYQNRTNVETAINRLVSSDFLCWFATRFFASKAVALLGIPPDTQERLTAEDWEEVHRVLESMLPLGARLPSIGVDQSRDFPTDMPVNTISVPTLVIHAQDDTLVPYANGEHTTQAIDEASFVSIPYGGHFLAGHSSEVRAQIGEFLQAADRR